MNSITYLAHSVDQAFRAPSHQDHSTIPTTNPNNGNNISDLTDPARLMKPITIQTNGKENISELKNFLEPSVSLGEDESDGKSTTSTTSNPSFIRRLASIIWFVPHLILIRPLLFFWYIFTFPLTLLEKNGSHPKHKEPTEEGEEGEVEVEEGSKSKLDESTATTTGTLGIDNNLTSSVILEIDEDDGELAKQTITPTSEELKSPMSNVLTKAAKLPFPKFVFPISTPKKTLILDLDETLVHSISKSSRSTKNGHMIEVKISQVATLYYVHKRPYCDIFLQKVSKWFDLVIFTASVKEYADPVIDWLETEKKYFSKRYYRNDCTLREGEGYIKDLRAVDSNLHSLIIIDNSPISYALHEDNAILVEGWINDDSDQDLLNLLPLLEALKYTNDVRPLLSLKNGAVAFEK